MGASSSLQTAPSTIHSLQTCYSDPLILLLKSQSFLLEVVLLLGFIVDWILEIYQQKQYSYLLVQVLLLVCYLISQQKLNTYQRSISRSSALVLRLFITYKYYCCLIIQQKYGSYFNRYEHCPAGDLIKQFSQQKYGQYSELQPNYPNLYRENKL